MIPVADLVDERYAESVAESLVACGAFTVDLGLPRERWFRWKSGIRAPFGCDCRRLNAFPEHRRLVDDALAAAVAAAFPQAGYVVGVAQAGIPWAKTLADRLGLPLAYVRAQPRAAAGPLVECAPRGRAQAIVVEDVVASGASTADAVRAILAETTLAVAGIQSIANWNFPRMRAALGRWPVRALTSYPQVLDCARASGLIDEEEVVRLGDFYRKSHDHDWQG